MANSIDQMSMKFRGALKETEALEASLGIEHPATARANGREVAAAPEAEPTRLSAVAQPTRLATGHSVKMIRLAALAAGVSAERVGAMIALLEEK